MPVPDAEKDIVASMPENKLTLDNLANDSDYSRQLLTSFQDFYKTGTYKNQKYKERIWCCFLRYKRKKE